MNKVKQKLYIKSLKQLGQHIDECGHSKWCELQAELGVYCTCGKEKAEDLCRNLIVDLEKISD